jgi:hypothetical protein
VKKSQTILGLQSVTQACVLLSGIINRPRNFYKNANKLLDILLQNNAYFVLSNDSGIEKVVCHGMWPQLNGRKLE